MTLSGFASSKSILLTATIIGTPASFAWLIASTVCGITPSSAATTLKTGAADYYVGACHTGGGGALAMAIAIVGKNKCETVSMPGRQPNQENIEQAVKDGKVAFGFTADHAERAVPMILEAISKN